MHPNFFVCVQYLSHKLALYLVKGAILFEASYKVSDFWLLFSSKTFGVNFDKSLLFFVLFLVWFYCEQISRRVFELIRSEGSLILSPSSQAKESEFGKTVEKLNKISSLATADDDADKSKSKPFEMYKRRTTVVVPREIFVNVVCDALAEYKYVGHDQRADLILACK